MLFNTSQYILFLPLVVAIYYLLPGTSRIRNIWLLIVSYYFYMQWNPLYVILLVMCTVITFVTAKHIEKLRRRESWGGERKFCLAICIIINLGILGFFKYFEFGIQCLNRLLVHINMNEISWNYDILLPVGISFYLLQALGYTIDVYRGEISAEEDFVRYALFVSFFPQLVAGPIERSKHLIRQLKEPKPFKYDNLRKGFLLIVYGLFLKMVIADKAAIIVDTVYGNSTEFPGFYIAMATIFFSIQIYCDFYGYSTIARGSALFMGIELMDNFHAPYYARSIKEFWRRWHVSLSGWFRDYLYIPMGGSRKGKIRNNFNLLAVFGISGLWHGASFSFIVWGLLNGIYQVVENIVFGMKNFVCQYMLGHVPIQMTDGVQGSNCFSRRIFERMLTFLLVTFAWLFFRAGSMHEAYRLLQLMFSSNNWMVLFDGSLSKLGVADNHMKVLVVSIISLFIVDYKKYVGKDMVEVFFRQGWCFRVLIYMLLVFSILLYGCYGTMYEVQQFIYFQF